MIYFSSSNNDFSLWHLPLRTQRGGGHPPLRAYHPPSRALISALRMPIVSSALTGQKILCTQWDAYPTTATDPKLFLLLDW